jgi:HD-like signal output (HDOD) protein
MDRREAFQMLAAEASRLELNFPTHAEVALRVRLALDDPEIHMDAAARLVQAEPLLAARVVAVANSVAFNRSGRPVADVRTAVARLGFQLVRALATAVVMRQMAGASTDHAHRVLATRLWEHTAHVASLAHVIARRITRQDPEVAMFAGIVHEVSGFYLLSRADAYPSLLEGDLDEWETFGEAAVGRAVLAVLKVPEKVTVAIEALWQGYLALPPVSLGDTLLLADILTPIESPLRSGTTSNVDSLRASVDLSVGEDTLAGILAESAEELESLTSALHF